MKIGWYFTPIDWPNAPIRRGQGHPEAVEAELDKCADHGIEIVANYLKVIEPTLDQDAYIWLREKLDERGQDCGIRMSPQLTDASWAWGYNDWAATGFDVNWLADKFSVFSFLDSIGFYSVYGGHEVLEFMKRDERKLWADAWLTHCPSIPVQMYVATFIDLQRTEENDHNDSYHTGPQPWIDYIVAGRHEPKILSWDGGGTNPVETANGRARAFYRMGAGYLDVLAHGNTWPTAGTAFDSPPRRYCHIQVRTTDKRRDIYQHLEWLNEQMTADDVLLLRTLVGESGDTHTEPWDDLYRLVKHFTEHH